MIKVEVPFGFYRFQSKENKTWALWEPRCSIRAGDFSISITVTWTTPLILFSIILMAQ